jgi:hypothetical protein
MDSSKPTSTPNLKKTPVSYAVQDAEQCSFIKGKKFRGCKLWAKVQNMTLKKI